MSPLYVQVKTLDSEVARFGRLSQGSPDAAGYDLRAAIKEPLVLQPGQAELLSTGLSVYIKDPGVCATILPRSGLGSKQGIVIGNLVGLIDADYQGPLKMCIWNRSDVPFTIQPYDRLAQLVFLPVIKPVFVDTSEFDTTSQRGEGGFASSGIQ